MAFTVNEFHDMLEILQVQPTWREELRRVLLGDDYISLPENLRLLRQSYEKLLALAERSEARMDRHDTDIVELKSDVKVLKDDVGYLKGSELERSFRERPFVYLSRFARRIRLVSDSELAILIEDALDQHRLTDDEAEDLKRLDAIVKGKHKVQNYDVYLAVEASAVADEYDLERAQRRAKLLEKATGILALPVVAGDVAAKGIMQLAELRGVYWVSRI